jgi:NADH-quinone oxidoreductase subunit M
MQYVLSFIFLFPLLGSLVTYLVTKRKEQLAKLFALFFSVLTFLVTLVAAFMFTQNTGEVVATNSGLSFLLVDKVSWVPQVGISYYLGIDGLSIPLVVLTGFVSIAAVLASPKEISRAALYYALILLLQTGVYGTFLALDFFLFFVCWELVLVPMFFLIGIWGGPKREYAAIYFFIYTHVASLVLLLGILGLWVVNVANNGIASATFSMTELADASLVSSVSSLIFVALFFGFIVKVPTAPFHTWLPLAHVEAPSPISMILAGLLLKMGGYGIIRVNFMILPDLFKDNAMIIALLGIFSLFWGGFVALRQEDLKRMVAYSSVAHMGMVLFGAAVSAATGDPIGLIGAQFMMIAHGVISPMLFNLVGVIQHATNTRIIKDLRGLTQKMPNLAGLLVFASMASLGLPGLAGFVSELYVFLGAFGWPQDFFGNSWPVLAFIAIFGVVVTVAFYLWMLQRIVWGESSETINAAHTPHAWEYQSLWLLVIPIILLGIFPAVLISPIADTFTSMAKLVL